MYDYKDVKGQGLFCIYDGHAGLGAAKWCEDHFSSILGNLMDQNEQRYPGERIGKQRLLNYAFMEADAQLAEDKSITSGCTVAVALFKPPPPTKLKLEEEKSSKHRIGTLYTANVGDGRIVLCQGGRAIRLSYDHKASDKREQQRIMEAGGFVAHDRVSGVLAVTRSLGDEELKEFVIGRPYTTKAKLTQESQFLIIACDGLWDVCGDQQACDLIQNIYAVDQLAAATRLVDFAIQAGSADNISVMVIAFKEQKTV